MPTVRLPDGAEANCLVDDFLWPWDTSTPVFMVHGYARNARFWDPWVPGVSARHRVYRPEIRGCGESAVPPPSFHFDAMDLAADLLHMLDDLGLDRVHWVGEHSGSLLGMVLALSAPDRIASLVLCDAPTHIPRRIHNDVYPMGEASTADALAKYGVAQWCAKTIDYRLDTRHADPRVVEWYIEQMGRTPVHVAAGLTNCFGRVSIADRIGEIQAPTLLLIGGASGWVAEQQLASVERLPDARSLVFEDRGHGVNLLAPDRCVAAALSLWQEVDKS